MGVKSRVAELVDIKKIEIRKKCVPIDKDKNRVLLKVLFCGICRTDAKMWELGHRDLVLPRVLGHEFCGIIEGSDDVFVAWPAEVCGECRYCKEKKENLCDNIKIMGFHVDGGFSEYVYVPLFSLVRIPKDLPPYLSTFAEPVGCCLNSIENMVFQGDKVLILGAGVMGNLLAICCKEKMADVYIFDPDRKRLERTLELRDRLNINLFSGKREDFDVVINATSSHSAFEKGISYLRKNGRFCFFSGISKKNRFLISVLNEIHYKELFIKGSYGCRKFHMQKALNIILKYQKEIHYLIDDFIPLDKIKNGFLNILDRKSLKLIVRIESNFN